MPTGMTHASSSFLADVYWEPNWLHPKTRMHHVCTSLKRASRGTDGGEGLKLAEQVFLAQLVRLKLVNEPG